MESFSSWKVRHPYGSEQPTLFGFLWPALLSFLSITRIVVFFAFFVFFLLLALATAWLKLKAGPTRNDEYGPAKALLSASFQTVFF